MLRINVGDTLYVSRRRAVPEVGPGPHTPVFLTHAHRADPRRWVRYARNSPNQRSISVCLILSLLSFDRLMRVSGDYVPPPYPHFLWVTEFPLFTRSDPDKDFLARGRWTSTHHPFTAPMWQDIQALYEGHIDQVRTPFYRPTPWSLSRDPMPQVRGQHYDLVLNGTEIGGGSVRVHDAALQDHIFSDVLQVGCGCAVAVLV